MEGEVKLSRRGFIGGLAAAAGMRSLCRPSSATAATSQARIPIREFRYSDVKLTGGPLKDQFERIHAAYLALDNDRLLKVYRQRAGLPAPGEDMGGWYDADGFVPGGTFGQYVSGLSRFANATGDAATYTKVRELVEGYAATLGPRNYPYASTKASTTWPCYILDKLEIGLLDARQFGGVRSAPALLARVIHGASPYLPGRVYDRGPESPKQAPYDEPYILLENLFKSYEVTVRRNSGRWRANTSSTRSILTRWREA